jgi:hypothetical protein
MLLTDLQPVIAIDKLNQVPDLINRKYAFLCLADGIALYFMAQSRRRVIAQIAAVQRKAVKRLYDRQRTLLKTGLKGPANGFQRGSDREKGRSLSQNSRG